MERVAEGVVRCVQLQNVSHLNNYLAKKGLERFGTSAKYGIVSINFSLCSLQT